MGKNWNYKSEIENVAKGELCAILGGSLVVESCHDQSVWVGTCVKSKNSVRLHL